MSATTVHPSERLPRERADMRAAKLLRHVQIRVQVCGESVVHAFAEEFTGEPCFLRAASAFTMALPDIPATRIDDIPLGAIWEALDAAVADTENVRPRSFAKRRVSA